MQQYVLEFSLMLQLQYLLQMLCSTTSDEFFLPTFFAAFPRYFRKTSPNPSVRIVRSDSIGDLFHLHITQVPPNNLNSAPLFLNLNHISFYTIRGSTFIRSTQYELLLKVLNLLLSYDLMNISR